MKLFTITKITSYLAVAMLEIVILFSIFSVATLVKQSPQGAASINEKEFFTYKSEKFGLEFNYPSNVSLNDSLGTSFYDDNLLLLEMYLDYDSIGSARYYSGKECRSYISMHKDQTPIKRLVSLAEETENRDIIDFQAIEGENYADLVYSYKNTTKNYLGDIAYPNTVYNVKQRIVKHYKDFQIYNIVLKLQYIGGEDECFKRPINQKSQEDYEEAYNIIADSLQLYPDDLNNIYTDSWLDYFSEGMDLYFKYPNKYQSEYHFRGWFVGNMISGTDETHTPRPSNPKNLLICNESACMSIWVLHDWPEPYSYNPTIEEITEQIFNNEQQFTGLNHEQLEVSEMETIDIGGKEALQILVESELGKEKGGGVIGMNLTYVFFEHDNRIIAVRYDASNELFEKITESISFEPYLNIK